MAADRRSNGGVYNGHTDETKLMEIRGNKSKAYFVRAGAINEFKLYENQMVFFVNKLDSHEIGTKDFIAIVEEIKDFVGKYEDKTDTEFIFVFEKGYPKSLDYPDCFAMYAHKDRVQFIKNLERPIGIGSGYQFALGFLHGYDEDIIDCDLPQALDDMFKEVSVLDSGTSEEYDVRFFN